MFNIQGRAFITNLKEVSPKLITGTVYTFRKQGEEFIPTFIKCNLVGNAITNLIMENILDKDKIQIKSSVLESNSWTNKDGQVHTSLELTIFNLERHIDSEEDKQDQRPKVNKSKFKR